jgi:ATP-dependent Clp protease ATP-binding subunit ClpC
VVLLDEIEKAHPEVFNILLQIMDDGHLTDAKGRRVDFRNAILIMTSNVGADLLRRDSVLGFAVTEDQVKTEEHAYDRMKEKVLGEMKNLFRPEFLNRIDATVVFRSLTLMEIRQIVDLMLARVRGALTEQQITLEVTDAAKDHLVEKGFDPKFGARPLRRAIQNMVEDQMAEGLLNGKFQRGETVVIDCRDGELVYEPKAKVLVETQS